MSELLNADEWVAVTIDVVDPENNDKLLAAQGSIGKVVGRTIGTDDIITYQVAIDGERTVTVDENSIRKLQLRT